MDDTEQGGKMQHIATPGISAVQILLTALSVGSHYCCET